MQQQPRTLKQNIKETRKASWMFAGYFFFLCVVLFFMVFFFFKAHAVQSAKINDEIIAYKEILNKHQLLKNKIDTVYYQLTLLNTGKVENDAFLQNYISDNMQDIRNIIGADSSSGFEHYYLLINQLDTILKQKNNIMVISDKEQFALKNLNACMNQVSKVKKALSEDPTRNFSK